MVEVDDAALYGKALERVHGGRRIAKRAAADRARKGVERVAVGLGEAEALGRRHVGAKGDDGGRVAVARAINDLGVGAFLLRPLAEAGAAVAEHVECVRRLRVPAARVRWFLVRAPHVAVQAGGVDAGAVMLLHLRDEGVADEEDFLVAQSRTRPQRVFFGKRSHKLSARRPPRRRLVAVVAVALHLGHAARRRRRAPGTVERPRRLEDPSRARAPEERDADAPHGWRTRGLRRRLL
mmetsp:Transcript_4295/g.15154  ORF Transcript_4295/g.15154 Transcript_4295/m.15154 type:complete len:237 (-) Transcript_4295:53-763(-)